jgi:putrescine transport system ATP-binding protein
MAMSDYVAVMDRGRIVQFGAPRDVYEAPGTRFVASFLGTINLFEGVMSTDPDGRQRLVTSDGLQVVHGVSHGIEPGGALGVRPEKLRIADRHTGLANDYAGTVTALSYCGNVSQLTIRLSGGRQLEATLVNSAYAGERPCTVGDDVHAGFAAEAVVALAP